MKIDNDLIAPFFVGLATIIFTVGQMYLMPISSAEQIMDENQALFAENAATNRENSQLTKDLEAYQLTQESLESLGASPIEAQRAMLAAKVYNIDPKSLEH